MLIDDLTTPVALLFGVYIIGAGYLALMSFIKENLSELKEFDKIILSATFGAIGFAILIGILNINIDLSNNQSIFNFLKGAPILFVINVFISKIIMEAWKYIHAVLETDFLGRRKPNQS